MMKQYGYRPNEVQSPYLHPAGWVYEVVHSQRQKENTQRKKENAQRKKEKAS